ncbi:FliH/SctL family protein [Hippea sp. KM1]|uniref:FliH/SctL family protein n=1 Tax=Hippea sp. KM1 TaxID=944481 RepID=UPI00046D7D2E|nr:FliH/SctL family protein [Hippea sp. KM1]
MPLQIEEYVFEDFDSENDKCEIEEQKDNNDKQEDKTKEERQQDEQAQKDNQNNFVLDKEAIKKELEAIIETTKQEALKQAQLIKEQAKKEGFELGYKEGYQKGLEDAKGVFDKTIADYTSKMQQAIEKLIKTAEEISKKYEELENVATDMVLNIAKKVIAKELDSDRDVIKNMVREALGLAETKKLKVKLNPEDAQFVKGVNLDESKTVEVVEDDSLPKGSLIIEEENGNVIDASVDTKLKQIKNSMVNE